MGATFRGMIEQAGLKMSGSVKKGVFLAWDQIRAARNLNIDIARALKDIAREERDAKKHELARFKKDHDTYERDIRDALQRFRTLVKDSFIEAYNMKGAIAAQHRLVQEIEKTLNAADVQQFKAQIKYDDAADRDAYSKLMKELANLAVTSAN